MNEIRQLHEPEWRFVEPDWVMIVGNRDVARLVPIPVEERGPLPWANWLSQIHPDYDHGWDCVEFEASWIGQCIVEQWWVHMCRGERYTGPTEQISRWTGEPLGEATGPTQSAGKGQSP
jgi:hypothetical protein